ncbi:MAG: SMI1/KNR4 family protein [Gammaproteobacteria bacterium]
MNFKLEKSGRLINESDLQAFETQIGKTLPEDYRDFLLKYNGGYPVPNYWCFKAIWQDIFAHFNEQLEVISFYSLDQEHDDYIRNRMEGIVDRIPENALPIGDSSSPVFLLMLDGPKRGQVLVWLPDTWGDHDQTNPDHLGFAAASFTEFLDNLYHVAP